ncbi:MAG: nitrous oxide reductase family maturation protein NosD [Chitinophagaceae bacterium]|nr:nitrous oxide reductase family maturation protein NosD [Chitinophagaceae bacterium]
MRININLARKLVFIYCLVCFVHQHSLSTILYVGEKEQFSGIKKALAASNNGDTIIITKGIYKEGNIVIDKSVCLLGRDMPVLDGELKYEILSIKKDSVTIKGLRLQNSGRSAMNDPGAIKIYNASYILIENNYLHNNFFGIFLQYATHCIIKNNTLKASQKEEYQSGNGIHCWKSDSLQVIGNRIYGHRDGIYFEFVTHSVIWRNIAHFNLRYGLHFMFSHQNAYITNYFKSNGAGVAVMFTKKVIMINNTFEENWGDAAYGVLFKELSDCYLSGNRFYRNTTGIFFDGSNRITAERNLFKSNGWGMRIQANCMDNKISRNNFMGNIFDVTTNGTLTLNEFSENYWDKYEGYDLDKDKIGDVPFHPLSLFSVIVERNPPAMLLFRSFMVSLMDKSEKIVPSLTPETFVDNKPCMVPHDI